MRQSIFLYLSQLTPHPRVRKKFTPYDCFFETFVGIRVSYHIYDNNLNIIDECVLLGITIYPGNHFFSTSLKLKLIMCALKVQSLDIMIARYIIAKITEWKNYTSFVW